MSDVSGQLARVIDAFDRPTLRLLDGKWAPVTLAVFRTAFSHERRAVPADELHAEVDALFEELRDSDAETPPGLNGRAACTKWMNDQWLYRSTDQSGQEEYSLTSHSLEAIRVVESLTHERAMISESRLTMILDTARSWAQEANPDPVDRVTSLDSEIAKLTAERDRLLAGGELAIVTDDRMLDGYQNLLDLLTLLPGDFRRVEEAVQAMHRLIVDDFRREDRPIGEVIDEYLDRVDRLMADTSEGRAFEGAFELLRSNRLLDELRSNLHIILDHPFATVLTPTEVNNFRATVRTIRQGIEDVLERRRRLSGTLRDHIVNHDTIRDRELEQALRIARSQLAVWMRTARPRDNVRVGLAPARLDIVHLRERFYDPADHAPPPPLQDVSEQAPTPPTLAELRSGGGPQFEVLRRALDAAAGSRRTAGAVFGGLDAADRRPVELMGLLQILDDAGTLGLADGDEQVVGIRPDGTRRGFAIPRVTMSDTEVENVGDELGVSHEQ